jgi:predicted Zn-dependent peptidase
MTILLAPDRTSPVFTFMVVYHVGSRNEAPATRARRTCSST